MSLSDLYLDTPHYGSHTVGSEAMYVVLPVLTSPGNSFASRVGLSLVHAANLQLQLACIGRKDCVDVAVKLITTSWEGEKVLLERIRKKLDRARGNVLFNSGCFARKLEYVFASLLTMRSRSTRHLFLKTACTIVYTDSIVCVKVYM